MEAIKQGLSLDPGKNFELQAKRKKLIETAIPELQSIAQLRRAYFLREWALFELENAEENKKPEVNKIRLNELKVVLDERRKSASG